MTSHGFNEQPLKLRLSEVESWRKQSGLVIANKWMRVVMATPDTNITAATLLRKWHDQRVSLAIGKANRTSHGFNEQPLKLRLNEVESWRKRSGLVIANKWMRVVTATPDVRAKS
ncbi:hypothetical protein CEXT_675171 [Caerostris extrusa]|uniref:Uncharacterized protein n=1 Tax=Caerostris extrusa TaxID=172846 RepID=A0AAV4XRP5_CAEEX|nr:hypothetical protein CEXT_675171 [Caerostris extrusa]